MDYPTGMQASERDRHRSALVRNSMEIEGFRLSDDVAEAAAIKGRRLWESGGFNRRCEAALKRAREKREGAPGRT